MDLILNITDNKRIHIQNFGPDHCGVDGKKSFNILIRDNGVDIIKIPNVTLGTLFTRFDLGGSDFLAGKYHSTDFFTYDPVKRKISGKTDLGFKLSLKAQYL